MFVLGNTVAGQVGCVAVGWLNQLGAAEQQPCATAFSGPAPFLTCNLQLQCAGWAAGTNEHKAVIQHLGRHSQPVCPLAQVTTNAAVARAFSTFLAQLCGQPAGFFSLGSSSVDPVAFGTNVVVTLLVATGVRESALFITGADSTCGLNVAVRLPRRQHAGTARS